MMLKWLVCMAVCYAFAAFISWDAIWLFHMGKASIFARAYVAICVLFISYVW